MPEEMGLYHKYHVTKRDGTPVPGFLFVLKPETDPAAIRALAAYAKATEDNALARDLWAFLFQLLFDKGEQNRKE